MGPLIRGIRIHLIIVRIKMVAIVIILIEGRMVIFLVVVLLSITTKMLVIAMTVVLIVTILSILAILVMRRVRVVILVVVVCEGIVLGYWLIDYLFRPLVLKVFQLAWRVMCGNRRICRHKV